MVKSIFDEYCEAELKAYQSVIGTEYERPSKTFQEIHDIMIRSALRALEKCGIKTLEIKGKRDYNEWGIDRMRLLQSNEFEIINERSNYKFEIRRKSD